MRHARFLPLALAALAGCSDVVTAPDPSPGPIGPVGERSGGAGVSDPLTVGWNEGGLMYAQNLPLPDVGGGRVVWQDAASGSAAVLAYDLRSGTRTQEGTVSGTFAWPATAGRWTVWSDGSTIYLRDEAAGTVRAIGTGAGYTAAVDDDGEVAYVDFGAGVGNVVVYDARTGETRRVTNYTSSSPEAAREVDVDGGIVAWSTFTRQSPYTTGIRMMDLRTGEEREIVHVNSQSIGAPSVSGRRIVWSDDRAGSLDVYLYDVTKGTETRITTSPGGEFNARISGRWIVWEDTRNSTSHYFPENDIYAYDLASRTEIPVATGPNHQARPRIDGTTVVWTERANDRWEIRTAQLRGSGRAAAVTN